MFHKSPIKRTTLMLLLAMLVMAAPLTAYAESVSVQSVQVNGKTYMDAEQVLALFGTTGKYDAKTGTYEVSLRSVPDVVQEASPSVVSIVGQDMELTDEGVDPRDALIIGSGFVIRKEGWIVTNAHVMESMKKPMVITSDGKTYDVDKVIADKKTDLAIIHIKAKNLKPLVLAADSSQPEVGETVIAIGTPFYLSLHNTVTVGVVSGLGRDDDYDYKLLQTDAAINPGNSGGPLLNMKGEVVGINVQKYYGEDVDNVGFSIPADTVRWVVEQLLINGKLTHPMIGLEIETSWAALVGLPTERSLKIIDVWSEQAKKSGIRVGDTLLAVNGQPVHLFIDINEALKGKLPGDKVKLLMLSNNKKVEVSVILSEAIE